MISQLSIQANGGLADGGGSSIIARQGSKRTLLTNTSRQASARNLMRRGSARNLFGNPSSSKKEGYQHGALHDDDDDDAHNINKKEDTTSPNNKSNDHQSAKTESQEDCSKRNILPRRGSMGSMRNLTSKSRGSSTRNLNPDKTENKEDSSSKTDNTSNREGILKRNHSARRGSMGSMRNLMRLGSSARDLFNTSQSGYLDALDDDHSCELVIPTTTANTNNNDDIAPVSKKGKDKLSSKDQDTFLSSSRTLNDSSMSFGKLNESVSSKECSDDNFEKLFVESSGSSSSSNDKVLEGKHESEAVQDATEDETDVSQSWHHSDSNLALTTMRKNRALPRTKQLGLLAVPADRPTARGPRRGGLDRAWSCNRLLNGSSSSSMNHKASRKAALWRSTSFRIEKDQPCLTKKTDDGSNEYVELNIVFQDGIQEEESLTSPLATTTTD